MKITNANKNNIQKIIYEINKEFIVKRNKSLNITQRYPNLFLENNYSNIFVLSEGEEDFASVLVAKSLDLKLEDQYFKLFFVGSQVTLPEHRGKGYGKLLFEYVANFMLDNSYDIGVGWTRLQDYYIKTGWEPYENGLYAECFELKTKQNESNELTFLYHENSEFDKIDNYRTKNNTNFIIRKYKNYFEGYGTIYTPGDKYICISVNIKHKIKGYIYGVVSQDKIIIYEYYMDDLALFFPLLKFVSEQENKINFGINLALKNMELPYIFENFSYVKVNIPQLSIYRYLDSMKFKKIKDFYIPFTDRI